MRTAWTIYFLCLAKIGFRLFELPPSEQRIILVVMAIVFVIMLIIERARR